MTRSKFLITAALLAVPLLMVAKEAEIRLQTRLAGGAISGLEPSGHADFRSRGTSRSRLNVEVEDVNLPAGTQVQVLVDGNAVGNITISAAPIRGGELELNSQDGDLVPAVKPGATVTVRNGASAILSGVLN